jgi:peptidyl-prolyl cis-trans isomerase D
MYRLFSGRRRKLYKTLMIIFLGLVSLGMVLTLAPLPGGSGQMQPDTLATIDGTQITIRNLEKAVEAQTQNNGDNDPNTMAHLAQSAFNSMIMHQAELDAAAKMGLTVSNAELVAALHSIPFLYQNGRFAGMQQYEAFVEEQGLTVAAFETQLRETLLLQKLQDAITDSIQVTPAEVHDAFERQNEKTKINYVIFQPSGFYSAVQVSPAALSNYFIAHQSSYSVPEQRQVAYVLIPPDAVRAQVNVTDAEIKQYYNQHLTDFSLPDRVKVSHILFKTVGETPQQASQTLATAKSVLKKIQGGANFAVLAKQYSQDTASASNGGELGWIVRGQTAKPFEDAAFSLKPGQISGLIKTIYGYHIVKVEDRQYAHVQSLPEATPAIQAKLEKTQLAAAQQALADRVSQELHARPQDFEVVAKQNGLTSGETPLFSYGQPVPDLGSNQAFENLAFQLPVGTIGQQIEVPKGIAFIEVTKTIPEHLPKLAEVENRVEEDYRSEQSKFVVAEKAKQFAAECKNGNFTQLAKKDGYTVQQSKDFTTQDEIDNLIPGSALSSAFTLEPGQSSQAIQVGSTYVAFQVISHTPANEASFASQEGSLTEQLLQQKRDLAFEIYESNLKNLLMHTGKLKINESALKSFLAGYQQNS